VKSTDASAVLASTVRVHGRFPSPAHRAFGLRGEDDRMRDIIREVY
jgi:hypothetical protein